MLKKALGSQNKRLTNKGIALLDESWSIYEFLCGDDHEKLRHYAIFDEQIRSGIEYMRKHPDRRIAGF